MNNDFELYEKTKLIVFIQYLVYYFPINSNFHSKDALNNVLC